MAAVYVVPFDHNWLHDSYDVNTLKYFLYYQLESENYISR